MSNADLSSNPMLTPLPQVGRKKRVSRPIKGNTLAAPMVAAESQSLQTYLPVLVQIVLGLSVPAIILIASHAFGQRAKLFEHVLQHGIKQESSEELQHRPISPQHPLIYSHALEQKEPR